jgi:predicted transport protein
MKQEGMVANIEVDLDDFMSKEFITFRKTKNFSEVQYHTKFHSLNLVNKHYVMRMDHILDLVRCG